MRRIEQQLRRRPQNWRQQIRGIDVADIGLPAIAVVTARNAPPCRRFGQRPIELGELAVRDRLTRREP
jgi:hypothetical protein